MNGAPKRAAAFAGSWYTERKSELAAQLHGWLQQADVCCPNAARAIIAPHAGYSYSGPTAAWAYKHVGRDVRRVFVLGPSHNVYLANCAVTRCSSYSTPLGDIPIDAGVRSELLASKAAFDPPLQGLDWGRVPSMAEGFSTEGLAQAEIVNLGLRDLVLNAFVDA